MQRGTSVENQNYIAEKVSEREVVEETLVTDNILRKFNSLHT